MTMKSRTYLAYRIDNERGKPPFGVVIVESEVLAGQTSAELDPERVRAVIDGAPRKRTFQTLLEELRA